MPKCYGLGTKECHQMTFGDSIYCSSCHRKKLKQLLDKASNWLLWLKLKYKCECEENAKCVHCCVSEELEEIDKILKD